MKRNPGGTSGSPPPPRERILAVVRRIPRGRVATYGQVAALAGWARHPRQVGYALADLPEGADVPWHRVINAQGKISPRSAPGWEDRQRSLLRKEGVAFDRQGAIDLARFRWRNKQGLRNLPLRRGSDARRQNP